MPSNSLPGILEDFVTFLIPNGDVLYKEACDAVRSLKDEVRRFKDRDVSKAVIHTWLAWQDDPGTPLGLAITKRYLDAELPEARRFVAWLTELFS